MLGERDMLAGDWGGCGEELLESAESVLIQERDDEEALDTFESFESFDPSDELDSFLKLVGIHDTGWCNTSGSKNIVPAVESVTLPKEFLWCRW